MKRLTCPRCGDVNSKGETHHPCPAFDMQHVPYKMDEPLRPTVASRDGDDPRLFAPYTRIASGLDEMRIKEHENTRKGYGEVKRGRP